MCAAKDDFCNDSSQLQSKYMYVEEKAIASI